MSFIRQAQPQDICRIAEIEIFNYRLSFYPIFRDDSFYFGELQVSAFAENYRNDPQLLRDTYVYDDGAVKGFIRIHGTEVVKLFVEPVLQGNSIGHELITFAVREKGACFLWALEKNTRAIRFYERHGFRLTDNRKPEEDTNEYLVMLTKDVE